MQGTSRSPDPIFVNAIHYRRDRLRVGQAMVPFCMLVVIAARVIMFTPLVMIAFAMMVGTLLLMVTARSSLGKRVLSYQKGHICLNLDKSDLDNKASNDPRVRFPRRDVTTWTWDGAKARLYAQASSWLLRPSGTQSDMLAAALKEHLGPPTLLRRRGSLRTRMLALAAVGLGPVLVLLAVKTETLWLLPVGIVFFAIGFGVFGAMSQKIAQ